MKKIFIISFCGLILIISTSKKSYSQLTSNSTSVFLTDTTKNLGVGTITPLNKLSVSNGSVFVDHPRPTDLWTTGGWKLAFQTPFDHAWRMETPTLNNNLYLGYGMSTNAPGWYWISSTGKRANDSVFYPMRLILKKSGSAELELVGGMSFRASSPSEDNLISSLDQNGKRLWVLNLADRSRKNTFGLYSDKIGKYVFDVSTDGNVDIKGDLSVDGQSSVKCLTIKGGCDWYEEANANKTIQPGYVVVIDTKGAINSVRLSSYAYDPLVTGVVSGAGGINPGIGLRQDGMLEGNTKIAMGGKVKVYVTGNVKPGDLLTSSNKAGYAMAVKNRKKAYGAVLGKALSMPDNDGLVLMQVTMQ